MKIADRIRGWIGFDDDEDNMPLFEFPFRSPKMMTVYDVDSYHLDPPQIPTEEMEEWLNQCGGKWQYINEMGCLWGVGFYDDVDAMAFKLRWS